MTTDEIVRALRICVHVPDNSGGDCYNCPAVGSERCMTETMNGAADLIEQLTAENADLRKELEWKDMVIALAQRKQTEAEAERDALLEYAKTMQECEMCKNDTFCHLREPMEDDCKHCQRVSDCPCQKCEENNCWEWRGLPETPEEGEEA